MLEFQAWSITELLEEFLETFFILVAWRCLYFEKLPNNIRKWIIFDESKKHPHSKFRKKKTIKRIYGMEFLDSPSIFFLKLEDKPNWEYQKTIELRLFSESLISILSAHCLMFLFGFDTVFTSKILSVIISIIFI